jgi:hypothetical protein
MAGRTRYKEIPLYYLRIVCSPKILGGLGVLNLDIMNIGLLYN